MLQKTELQQMSEKRNEWYEQRILKDIEEIETRIRELETEKLGLKRTLMRLRREDIASKEVRRKDSINRILIEKRILEELKSNKNYLNSKELYHVSRSVVFDLNENTFRSHLHRMKKRGLIKNFKNKRGLWIYVE